MSVSVSSERSKGRNNEYNANRCIAMHDMTSSGARGALTRYEVVPVKEGNIRENIPGVLRFRTDESEGESCVFAMLGVCGRRTGCVSGFISSSNFHVQSFFIRATVYFILILKELNHF